MPPSFAVQNPISETNGSLEGLRYFSAIWSLLSVIAGKLLKLQSVQELLPL